MCYVPNDKLCVHYRGMGMGLCLLLFSTGACRDFFADTGFLLPHFFVSCCKNEMIEMITCGHGPLDVETVRWEQRGPSLLSLGISYIPPIKSSVFRWPPHDVGGKGRMRGRPKLLKILGDKRGLRE